MIHCLKILGCCRLRRRPLVRGTAERAKVSTRGIICRCMRGDSSLIHASCRLRRQERDIHWIVAENHGCYTLWRVHELCRIQRLSAICGWTHKPGQLRSAQRCSDHSRLRDDWRHSWWCCLPDCLFFSDGLRSRHASFGKKLHQWFPQMSAT